MGFRDGSAVSLLAWRPDYLCSIAVGTVAERPGDRLLERGHVWANINPCPRTVVLVVISLEVIRQETGEAFSLIKQRLFSFGRFS